MIDINFQNAEELIFSDRKVQELFPESRHLFDQYRMSVMLPGMRQMGQRSILQFLESVDEGSVARLEKHFGEQVSVSRIRHRSVEDASFQIGDDLRLCEFSGHKEFCLTRSGEKVSVTFWS